jgi:hypothetical protein
VLCNVAHWTGWNRHFGPLSGSDPKIENPEERYILTAFSYGWVGLNKRHQSFIGILRTLLQIRLRVYDGYPKFNRIMGVHFWEVSIESYAKNHGLYFRKN